MATIRGCLLGSDNQMGPRIPLHCRSFDFTLLFEDVVFVLIPSVLLLLLLLPRFRNLHHERIKSTSYKLARWKLVRIRFKLSSCDVFITRANLASLWQLVLTTLSVFHIIFAAFRATLDHLYTTVSLASTVINAIAILAACYFSFMEDRKLSAKCLTTTFRHAHYPVIVLTQRFIRENSLPFRCTRNLLFSIQCAEYPSLTLTVAHRVC